MIQPHPKIEFTADAERYFAQHTKECREAVRSIVECEAFLSGEQYHKIEVSDSMVDEIINRDCFNKNDKKKYLVRRINKNSIAIFIGILIVFLSINIDKIVGIIQSDLNLGKAIMIIGISILIVHSLRLIYFYQKYAKVANREENMIAVIGRFRKFDSVQPEMENAIYGSGRQAKRHLRVVNK